MYLNPRLHTPMLRCSESLNNTQRQRVGLLKLVFFMCTEDLMKAVKGMKEWLIISPTKCGRLLCGRDIDAWTSTQTVCPAVSNLLADMHDVTEK